VVKNGGLNFVRMGILTKIIFLPLYIFIIMMFFSRKKNDVETIEDNNEMIKLHTTNGVVKAKKILSLNGKHVIYIDQYGNVREALLK